MHKMDTTVSLFHITGQLMNSLFQHYLKTMEDHVKRKESFINVLTPDMSEFKLKQSTANTCGLSRDAPGLASVGFPCPQSYVTHDVMTSKLGTKEEVAMFRFPVRFHETAGRR